MLSDPEIHQNSAKSAPFRSFGLVWPLLLGFVADVLIQGTVSSNASQKAYAPGNNTSAHGVDAIGPPHAAYAI